MLWTGGCCSPAAMMATTSVQVSVGRPAPPRLTPHCTEILEFDPDTTDWKQVGTMENGGYKHATVAITQPDFYCG